MNLDRQTKPTSINDLAHDGDDHQPESIMSSGIDNFNTEQPAKPEFEGQRDSFVESKAKVIPEEVEMKNFTAPTSPMNEMKSPWSEYIPRKKLGMEMVPPLKYNHNYRNASCCSKVFYGYIVVLFNKIKANDDKMTVDMVDLFQHRPLARFAVAFAQIFRVGDFLDGIHGLAPVHFV